MRIYGPESSGWDCIYLSVGSQLGGEVERRIRAAGYDPFDNTKESVARAKKEAKDARNIAKVLHLSCIAEGTLVRVQGQGWKPIETVTASDVVWDGESWVSQSGFVLRGTKTCVNFGETVLTPDHEVLTYDGWKMAEGAAPAQCVRPNEPSASWSDVWAMVCSIFRSLKGC